MDLGFSDSRGFAPSDSAGGLRPLGWGELCARLAAAQDLRRAGLAVATAATEQASTASFHQASAILLRGEAGPRQVEQAEGHVNPIVSANGNHGHGTTGCSEALSTGLVRTEPTPRDMP